MIILNPRRRLLLLLLLLVGAAAPAFAVDFNAYWEYRERGGENIVSTSQFQQRYSLGLGPGLSLDLTPAISVSANLAYNRSQRDVGDGMTTVEELRPSAQISLTNDIFVASLSGDITENYPDNGDKFTTNSWNASLASNWMREFWPSISLNYAETTETFPGFAQAEGAETEDRSYSLSLDWDLRLASFYYDYSTGESDNLLNDSREERQTHLARVETDHSFWNKRINYSLSHQYQQSDSDFFLLSEDGFVEVPLLPASVEHLVTAPAGAPLPGDADFDDQLTSGLPPPVADGERLYLVNRFDFAEQVDRIDLTIDPIAVDGNQVAALGWSLYLWNGGSWVLATASLPATYNAARERIELSLDLAEPVDRILVSTLVDLPGGLEIIRLRAISLVTNDSSSHQTSHLTNASLRVQLMPSLSASSSISLEMIDNQNSSDFATSESESTRRNLTGGLQWSLSPFIIPSISYSETRDESSVEGPELRSSLEEVSRRYSLIVATYPLPTLNVTLGATRTERFTDGRQTFTSDGYSLTSTASIYPDLTASLNVSYLVSERYDLAENAFAGTTLLTDGSSDTLTTRLTLNAHLTPSLTADLTVGYRDNQGESTLREIDSETNVIVIDPGTGLQVIEQRTSGDSSIDSELSLLYRPSSLLSTRLNHKRYWSGVDTPDTWNFNMNLALLRTYNTRLSFFYNHNQSERTVDRFALNGSWDISRNLSLRTDLSYQFAERQTWNILAALTLRL